MGRSIQFQVRCLKSLNSIYGNTACETLAIGEHDAGDPMDSENLKGLDEGRNRRYDKPF